MRKLLLIILFLLMPLDIYGATYTCGSGANSCTSGSACTISNLNTCISNASDGDTINIAAGTYNWTPSTSSYVNVNKRVTISGGGYCGSSIDDDPGSDCGDIASPSGSWPVTLDVGSGNDYNLIRINVTSAGSDIVRISGIHFTGKTYTSSYQYCSTAYGGGHIRVHPTNIAQYRIDNNSFVTTSTSYMNCDVVVCAIDSYGVIDHNYFHPSVTGGKTFMIMRMGSGEGEWDCQEGWTDPADWGTANFVYIEDNTVVTPGMSSMGPMFIDSFCGARFVVRYNYLYNVFSEFHGFSGGSYTTPGYAMEWYNNTQGNSSNSYRIFWFRGGTGLVHDNTISGTYGNCAFQFGENYRGSTSWGSITGSSDYDGNCQSGSSNPNNDNVDTDNGFPYDCAEAGNSYPTGYPSLCTPGWGQLNSAVHSEVQPQEYEPIHIWSNSGSFSCNSACAGYPSNCWHGLSETQSNATCLNRDVFFSTDDSAKPAGYTPYTYPHPLQGGDSIPPAPPVLAQ